MDASLTPSRTGTAMAVAARLELPLVQMLCSRLCHDLAGPAGAVGAGVDLLADAPAPDPEALELVALGARQLGARLAYYRVAFGFGGSREQLSWPGVRGLAEALLAGGRVRLLWQQPATDDAALPADAFRLTLLLLLLAAEALPRGGTVQLLRAPGQPLTIEAKGAGAGLAAETRAALFAGDGEAVTSRTVTALYAARLAEGLGTAISVEPVAGGLAFRLPLPGVGAC